LKPHRYLDEAEQEFRDQIGYFDGISRAVAIRFVDEIERAVDEIREHPRIGAPLGRLLRRRVLTGFKYSVLYVDPRPRSSSSPSRRIADAPVTGVIG
jgi:plasmid stabilization system protein ParE